MDERCYFAGVTFDDLRRELARIAPAVLEALAGPGETVEGTKRFERPPNGPYRFHVTTRRWERAGVVAELSCEEATRDTDDPARPRRSLESLQLRFTVRAGADWLAELQGSVLAQSNDDPVLGVIIRGNWRAVAAEQWAVAAAPLATMCGRVPLPDAPVKAVTRDGRTLYGWDAITRDTWETITGWSTREGRDAAILSGDRIYWECEYAGVVGDEPVEAFLARHRAGSPQPDCGPVRVDFDAVAAAILGRRPELEGR